MADWDQEKQSASENGTADAKRVAVRMDEWGIGSPLLGGQYCVEKTLGIGGMGQVYLVGSEFGPSRGNRPSEKFAVKRARAQDRKGRTDLLVELLAWFDLPDHPNLVPLRFVRTQGEELIVFSEYVSGGSLHAWIGNGKEKTLEELLDLSIQFAWGVHAVHAFGLIHQDVKPANALLTPLRQLKVSDFGIARMRRRTQEGEPEPTFYTTLGGSKRYGSPEQAQARKASLETSTSTYVTRTTDIWSWAVSVLHLFKGDCDWTDGAEADRALEEYLNAGTVYSKAAMPAELGELLRSCLDHDVERRGTIPTALAHRLYDKDQLPKSRATMLDISRALRMIYRSAIGKEHERSEPQFPKSDDLESDNYQRMTAKGDHWADPREWIAKALAACNRNADSIETFLPPKGRSMRARAMADLLAYEEAEALYLEAGRTYSRDQVIDLEPLHSNQALLHEYLSDGPGAIARYGQAIGLCEPLVAQGRRDLVPRLGWAYTMRANVLAEMGRLKAALADHNRAVEEFLSLRTPDGPSEAESLLAGALMNRANVYYNLGKLEEAVSGFASARAIYERLGSEGWNNLENDLAGAEANRSMALAQLGHFNEAVSGCDVAISILDRLLKQCNRPELAERLARAMTLRAGALAGAGRLTEALLAVEAAITSYKRAVHDNHRQELVSHLAVAVLKHADILKQLKRFSEALSEYEETINIYELLLYSEGRLELARNLATAMTGKASTLGILGRLTEAVAECDSSITVVERLVYAEGHSEHTDDLAFALMSRASVLAQFRQLDDALAGYESAIALYEHLVLAQHRTDLIDELANASVNRATVLLELGRVADACSSYGEAIRHFECLVEQEGQRHLAKSVALARMNRAVAFREIGRQDDALCDYELAIRIYEQLIHREGRAELSNELAKTLINRANVLGDLGRHELAMSGYASAIELLERLRYTEQRTELTVDVAWVFVERANVLTKIGQLQQAIKSYGEAISLYEELVKVKGREELLDSLAGALGKRATAHRLMGRLEDALSGYDSAIAIRERLVHIEHQGHLATGLAAVLMGRANTLTQMNLGEVALLAYAAAIRIYDRLVHTENQEEQADNLAAARVNHATCLRLLGRLDEALSECDIAIGILQSLVEAKRRHQLAPNLAMALMNRAIVLRAMNRYPESVRTYGAAIDIYERLVNMADRADLASDLAAARMNRAIALEHSGQPAEALADYDAAIDIFQRLVRVQGRDDLSNDLETALTNRALALRQMAAKTSAPLQGVAAVEWFRDGSKRKGPHGPLDFDLFKIPRSPLADWASRVSNKPGQIRCTEIRISDLRRVTDTLFDAIKKQHQLDSRAAVELFDEYLGAACSNCFSGITGHTLQMVAAGSSMAAIFGAGAEFTRILSGRCSSCESDTYFVVWHGDKSYPI